MSQLKSESQRCKKYICAQVFFSPCSKRSTVPESVICIIVNLIVPNLECAFAVERMPLFPSPKSPWRLFLRLLHDRCLPLPQSCFCCITFSLLYTCAQKKKIKREKKTGFNESCQEKKILFASEGYCLISKAVVDTWRAAVSNDKEGGSVDRNSKCGSHKPI